MKTVKRTGVLLLIPCIILLTITGCSRKTGTPPALEHTAEEPAGGEEDAYVTREFDFYSDDEHLILYNFPGTCTLDGKSYSLLEDGISYETLGTRDTVQAVVDMNVEELSEIPETYTYSSPAGKSYELKNEQVYIEEQGMVKIPVTEEVYYENQVGRPSIPARKTILYYDRAEKKDKETEGFLKEYTESTAGHWESILNIDGLFMAPGEDCDVYELSGASDITVSRKALSPIWATYEKDLIGSLQLDGRYYRITGAAWNGEPYWSSEGYLCRAARFTGDMFVSTYKATYEAERTASGYKTRVFYRTDATDADTDDADITTVYHIRAIVKYRLVE